MKVDYNKIEFSDEFLRLGFKNEDRLYESIDITPVSEKIDKSINDIKKYNKLIKNYDDMSGTIFNDFIKELANIELEQEDYLNILSFVNGKEYDRVSTIETSMITRSKLPFRISYKAAISKGLFVLPGHIYNTKELSELVDTNSIVLLEEVHKPLNSSYDEIEYRVPFNVYSKKDFTSEDGELYIVTLKYIKNKFSSELLRNKMDEYIKYLEDEIRYMCSFGNNNSNYREVSQELKRKFDKEYRKIINDLRK